MILIWFLTLKWQLFLLKRKKILFIIDFVHYINNPLNLCLFLFLLKRKKILFIIDFVHYINNPLNLCLFLFLLKRKKILFTISFDTFHEFSIFNISIFYRLYIDFLFWKSLIFNFVKLFVFIRFFYELRKRNAYFLILNNLSLNFLWFLFDF
jgi:hypothetical protein